MRGLLDADGRKTPARISEHVLGCDAAQPLQQFVSQSPWECADVRRRLAERMSTSSVPDAWVIDEVVFPKNGSRSAGVARQFVPTKGRTANCQLALAFSLVTERASVPVNWRLLMPPHWDDDQQLRGAARVPDGERSQPRWRHVLDGLDEMAGDWDLAPAPVIADWRHEPEVTSLLDGLEARGFGYLVEVAAGARLGAASAPIGTAASRIAVSRIGTAAAPVTCADLVHGGARRSARVTLSWLEGLEGRTRRSEFLVVQVPARPERIAARTGLHPRRPRQLLIEWPADRPQPQTHWITNLGSHRLPDLVRTAKLRWRSQYDLGRIRDEHGLADFEGRTFRGWHHHVTLASAAYGFQALEHEQLVSRAPEKAEWNCLPPRRTSLMHSQPAGNKAEYQSPRKAPTLRDEVTVSVGRKAADLPEYAAGSGRTL